MVYAQVRDNIIVNTILVDETTPLELFSEGFDHFLRVDDLIPQPGIGWSYDGHDFSAPIEPEPDITE